MDLWTVSSSLNSLSNSLSHDPDLEKSVNAIVAKGNDIAKQFSDAVKKEGREIFLKKSCLASAVTVNDVIVNDLHVAVAAAQKACEESRDSVIKLQTDIHSTLENCRGRKMKHENTMASKRAVVSTITGQLSGIDVFFKTYDKDVADLDEVAKRLDNQANDIKRAGRKRKNNGLLGAVVGVALAPFTGGASLALGAVYAGVNTSNANDCFRHARHKRDEANSKRSQADTLRKEKKISIDKKSSLETEIETLNKQKEELDRAVTALGKVIVSLQRAVPQMDIIILALQNMGTELKGAEVEADSFTIIQSAFNKTSAAVGNGRWNKYLDNLKTKWNSLETVLNANGATYSSLEK